MSLSHLPLRTLFLAMLLLQVACGSDELSVRGEVSASVNGGESHVFSFPGTINLAPASYESDVFSGHCEFIDGTFSAGITRPGLSRDGLSQVEFQTGPGGASANVFVDDALYDGECEIEVLYSHEGDGVFGGVLSCDALSRIDGTATLSGELHFAGCASL